MPHFQMLIGLPGCGKSTWHEKQKSSRAVILSTDKYIEFAAKCRGMTYNECFKDSIKDAEVSMYAQLAASLSYDYDLIWDQTNLSQKTRAKKLAKIPKHYTKEAIIFLTNPQIIDRINEERKSTGRALPEHILESMKKNFDISKIAEEGFDTITYIERN